MILTFILTIIGLIIGAAAAEAEVAAAIIGGLAGFATGGMWLARKRRLLVDKRLDDLEEELAELRRRSGVSHRRIDAPEPETTPVPPEVAAEPGAEPGALPSEAPVASPQAEPAPRPFAPPTPDPITAAIAAIKAYFLGGNTVVRVGILVLIVGVGLLGKWAADHEYFPPEARLILAALIGIVLIIIGWRLREKRRGYAISLQGGGVGVIYMTVFLALRLYQFIPAPLAFGLLVALAIFSQVLAVLQDAKAMAVLGVLGGFLAPIMASTGEGRYLVLFTYYTILNIGIFGVAWFKAWRLLNWLGFLFTFSVTSAWILGKHQTENFASTEPFLIIFFLIYVAIPVLYAFRQPPKLKGLVDGCLVFGTPIAVFICQTELVEGEKFGMALSSFTAAAFYLGLASTLFARAPKTMRNLTEAFLALGIVFGTMAIPFAVDDHHLTGATWALEGAGLVWLGIRQRRWLARVAGVSLQVAAAIAFAASDSPPDMLPFLNGRFLGCTMLAGGGLFIAWYSYRRRDQIHELEYWGGFLLLIWGISWWLGGGGIEIVDLLTGDTEISGVLGLFVMTAVIFELAGRALDYPPGRNVALGYLPVAYVFLPIAAANLDHPFGAYGFVPWLVGFFVYYLILLRHEGQTNTNLLAGFHAGTLWAVTIVSSWEAAWLIDDVIDLHPSWAAAAVQLMPALILAGVLVLQKRRRWWPVGPRRVSYLLVGAGLIAAGLIIISLIINLKMNGDADPLPYLPLANPLDLAQAFAFVAILSWYATVRCLDHEVIHRTTRHVFIWVISTPIFIWLNGLLVRTIHHWADVPFRDHAMWSSSVFQTSISIFWTVLALTSMVVSTKMSFRTLWIVSAVVLGVVVLKLFAVDLSFLGTGLRIVSFMVVGSLLVLVGYLSPIPPAKKNLPTDAGDKA